MEEEWRWVADYEGRYQVSNRGQVRSFVLSHTGRLLKSSRHPKGYVFIVLRRNGITRFHLIHRLVATAFLPNPDRLPEVNHKNAIKNDNNASNLEWATRSQNMLHGWSLGIMKSNGVRGQDNYSAKLTSKKVLKIRALHASGKSQVDIAAKFRVDPSTISVIIRRRSWAHI